MILTTDDTKYQLTKELLDQMRSVDGFPTGKDEDIIALSDTPYYTACPNPWIEDFIKENGKPWDPKTDSYNCEPFAADVSEGKSDSIYNAHTYHTKVPHKAIMRYILHYTEPGDIVFDGFCGTGMTGIAAQRCGDPDTEFKEKIERDMPTVKWGARKAILIDLSPAATFIAYNYNTPVDAGLFENEISRIFTEFEKECGWMYETQHVVDGKPVNIREVDGSNRSVIGKINNTIWSDVFICANCAKELVFWNVAVDKEKGEVRDEFQCPYCNVKLSKRSLDHSWEQVFDEGLNQIVKRTKQVPVLIIYTAMDERGKSSRFEKTPDSYDLALIKKIDEAKIKFWYPKDKLPQGDKTRDPQYVGITHVHQFYTKRNLLAYGYLWNKFLKINDHRTKMMGLFSLTAANRYLTRMSKIGTTYHFKGGGGAINAGISGTLYIPSFPSENNVITTMKLRIQKLLRVFEQIPEKKLYRLSTQSSDNFLGCPSNSLDYIFVDPPFGGNLMYSELNLLWEAWLKNFTNNQLEAVVNSTQKKGLSEYQHIMERCFKEFYRILKPGRWMTVEFHNSQNSVWMSIQEALQIAGFVVADVRTLDKKQGSFNQVQGTSQSVKQDLIISAYKPNGGLEDRFKLSAGKIDGVWDFIRQHLKHLPVFVEKDGIVQVILERQPHLLFDRMIAFHVQRGVIVPISAGDFYTGLRQRFPERDGMYFLENEVPEYDKKRMNSKRIEQASLFVHDEKSAVQWLHKELSEKSQTYADIMPKFLQELHQDKFEKLPELSAILEQNFLQDLKGQWYVPDPNKQADLDKVRERALLKEFDEYKKVKGKLKVFRTEAVRMGFKKAWSDRDYSLIITVGERLPSQILQEDDVLLMYYDNALTRQGNS